MEGDPHVKTVAVIGPDHARAQAVATQLMRCRAVVGAGPQDNPDGVIAVVGECTERDYEVVNAVRQAMGAVILYRVRAPQDRPQHQPQDQEQPPPTPWPEQVGVFHCTSVAEVQEAVDGLVLSRSRWTADARRADLERADRVRIAVRVEMNKVTQALIDDGAAEDPQAAHEQFLRRLRAAVLRQGVAWPAVDTECDLEAAVQRRNVAGEFSALAAGLLGGLLAGFALGRVLGQPLLGLAVGLLIAVVGAGTRLFMVRSSHRAAEVAKRGAALRETWMGLVADVMSRVNIPRVADQIGGGR